MVIYEDGLFLIRQNGDCPVLFFKKERDRLKALALIDTLFLYSGVKFKRDRYIIEGARLI